MNKFIVNNDNITTFLNNKQINDKIIYHCVSQSDVDAIAAASANAWCQSQANTHGTCNCPHCKISGTLSFTKVDERTAILSTDLSLTQGNSPDACSGGEHAYIILTLTGAKFTYAPPGTEYYGSSNREELKVDIKKSGGTNFSTNIEIDNNYSYDSTTGLPFRTNYEQYSSYGVCGMCERGIVESR